jgi:ethanolamine ammonia-lyase small subunit
MKNDTVENTEHIKNGNVVDNPWQDLRRFTDARIALGRAGISLPTAEMLAFQLSHAQARDAVSFPLDIHALAEKLKTVTHSDSHFLYLQSQAKNRALYLQRPDLGRKINEASRQVLLDEIATSPTQTPYDLAIVVVDGLSSLAVQTNAHPFITELLTQLHQQSRLWRIAPISLVQQGRVAIGDDIGELLNANMVMVLIGERPGLSSPDSLGLYLTWQPKTGLNDASRNCISNIRPAGLSYAEAVRRAVYLMNEANKLKLSGVNLKDRTEDDVIEHQPLHTNFLIGE